MNKTVDQALQGYFEANGFDEGSYSDPTFSIPVLGRLVTVPNPVGRQQGIRVHDLHHVVTGYSTDLVGESEAAAFELGAGVGLHYGAALFFTTTAFVMGLLRCPVRTMRAFVRGCGVRKSLYQVIRFGDDDQYQRVLHWMVRDLRVVVGLGQRRTLRTLARLPLVVVFALIGVTLWPLLALSMAIMWLRSPPI